MKKYTKAVVIGRFQPTMHLGHVSMIHKALEVAEKVYIVIGSANKYPDIKDPVPFHTRKFCVMDILCEDFTLEQRNRIVITSVNDYKYNDEKWKTEVRYAVDELYTDKIAMIGFHKDEDSYWLHEFGWTHIPVEPTMVNFLGKYVPMSSTFIRDHWLRTGKIILGDMLPNHSKNFLKDFTWTNNCKYKAEFDRLHEERLYWDKELKKFEGYPYPEALHACCADAVVICNNHILLIERKFAPGKGALALPGGHKESHETFRYAALRELEEEVGLKVSPKVIRGSIKGSQMFDDPNRSNEISKPTVAQYIVLQPNNDGKLPRLQAGSDAKQALWVPLHVIKRDPSMIFADHFDIITHFTGI